MRSSIGDLLGLPMASAKASKVICTGLPARISVSDPPGSRGFLNAAMSCLAMASNMALIGASTAFSSDVCARNGFMTRVAAIAAAKNRIRKERWESFMMDDCKPVAPKSLNANERRQRRKVKRPFQISAILAILAFLAIAMSFILHVHQRQPTRRRGCRSGRPVTQLQYAAHIFNPQAAFAHPPKCSHQVSHHVMEKTIPAHGVLQLIASPLPLRAEDGAHVVGLFVVAMTFGIDRRERRKVMLAFYHPRRLDHARLIQRVRMMIDITGKKRRANFAAKDPVLIGLCHGRLARVELRRHLLHAQHAYRLRQNVMERAHKVADGNWRLDSDAGRLRQRVDSGIGASGALRQCFFTG